MKRGVLILIIGILSGGLAATVVWWFSYQSSPESWFRQKFGLSKEQAQQAAALHQGYQVSCTAMCARIAQANGRLAKAMRESKEMTPEIRAAIAETDNLRTECRANMLEYFYKIAELLPREKRQSYLNMVLPTVQEPEEMSGMHHP